MQKHWTVFGILLALLLLAAPAHAQGAACYPPPCGTAPEGLERTLVAVDAEAAPIPPRGHRSPAPVVAAGLLMVLVSFGLIAASRRSAIVRSGTARESDHRELRVAPPARPVAQLSDVR